MQNNGKKIEITKEQAEEILGNDYAEALRIGEITVHCGNCGPFGPITDMTTDRYLLNDLGDVILEGTCDKCGAKVARYFETGENPKSFKTAKEILNHAK